MWLPKEFGRPPTGCASGTWAEVPLEPITSDVDAWFAELDRNADVPPFDGGRNQPPTPPREDLFGSPA